MAEFETGLPSVRQIQSFIKDQKEVEVKVSTNDLLVGKIIWQDPACLCISDRSEQQTIVWRQAIVYLKPDPKPE
ncbi:MAG: RNA-binding protein hfq [Aphanothece sp. CMT-3BRIN-NPC111]|jgi:host factor-I protein|nr:RNA-binding protein hfq [Aphanothece sp. CMT-3BRIN-NPC111]